MRTHFKYLSYILRHKWFVLVECYKAGILWRGLMHDLSKFLPSEWFPYVHYFYGKKQVRDSTGYYKPTDTGDKAFDFAWLLHQKRNDHHWQWWVLPEDDGDRRWSLQAIQPETCPLWLCKNGARVAVFENDAHYDIATEVERLLKRTPKVLPMSDVARKEMLCDWRGAGRAQGYGDNTVAWYLKNKDKMVLHRDTRAWIEKQLGIEG